MNHDDLLTLLDLPGAGAPVPAGDTPLVGAPADRGRTTAAHSLTALAVDEWGLRCGRDLIAESDRLRSAGTDEHAAADFFAAAFDPDPQVLQEDEKPDDGTGGVKD